jgi:hypothetical protein
MRNPNPKYAQKLIELCFWFYYRILSIPPPDGSNRRYSFYAPDDNGLLSRYAQTGFANYLTARRAYDRLH